MSSQKIYDFLTHRYVSIIQTFKSNWDNKRSNKPTKESHRFCSPDWEEIPSTWQLLDSRNQRKWEVRQDGPNIVPWKKRPRPYEI